ncbi:MAG: M6 family metalloprotease domain-containing protein [Paludibacteraceae bacterium]|nr:M6 family metalloprotease domain-containing protein [Paludibacteraceae bacterium]
MKKIGKIGLVSLIGLVGMIGKTNAVPAAPGKTLYTQPDGTQVRMELRGDEFFHYLVNEQGDVMVKGEDGFFRPQGPLSQTAFLQKRKAAKTRRRVAERQKDLIYNPAPKGLVLLVQFSDLSLYSASTLASIDEMCNGENYTFEGAYGSAKQYFRDQSDDSYVPQFDVVGPLTLSHGYAYYGANDDARVPEAVAEACLMAKSQFNINFAQYDSDNDGYVDFVYMIYAGYGEHFAGADPNYIWPHKYTVRAYDHVVIDGKTLDTYACSCELNGTYGHQRSGIGTLCHEFSHVLGLPDYYDTQYGENYENDLVPGEWDIMAGGSHNMDGKSPCNYSPHEKFQFDWANPHLLRGSQALTLQPSHDYYYISLDGLPKTPSSPDTVYYIENRQQRFWDRGLPGHGLMIWRVVYDEAKWDVNGPNDTPGEANYIYIPASGIYRGASSEDPFPGTRSVHAWDVPNSLFSIRDITENGSTVSLRFVEGCDGYMVSVNAPYVTIPEHLMNECCPAGSQYVATMQVRKNYRLLGIEVKCNDVILTQGTDYTFIDNVLTIPSLQGNTEITVNTEKIPFDYDHCMFFYWHPDSAVKGNDLMLDNIHWTLSVTGSSYRAYDSPATNRGAQFGSRSTSPGDVVFHTDEMANCLITTVQIEASTPDGNGKIEVVVDDETLSSKRFNNGVLEFIFQNPEEWHGAVDIKFTDLQKALYVKKIAIHFAEETENPNGLENIKASAPQGPVTGIYSATGQYMGSRMESLPRGLYFVQHTDGTEKILIP